jgi:hypothetical protein
MPSAQAGLSGAPHRMWRSPAIRIDLKRPVLWRLRKLYADFIEAIRPYFGVKRVFTGDNFARCCELLQASEKTGIFCYEK